MMMVRLATMADAGSLAVLNRDVQRLHADAEPGTFIPPDDLAPIVADFQGRVLTDVDGRVFLVEMDGEAVGYVYVRIIQRPQNAYTYALNFLHIDQIAVKSAHQGSGCGRALMQAVFDLACAEGIERVTLDTWAFNTQAQGFFAKMGFKVFMYRMDCDVNPING
jgi:ribosomal protein S18 acetylase RimI-like enzyme